MDDGFKADIEEILIRLFDEKITGIDLMFRLARSAIEFAKRGDIEHCDQTWHYARRFYSIGRAEFERRLRSGMVWDDGKQ